MLNCHFVHHESYMKPQVSELDLLGDKPAPSCMRYTKTQFISYFNVLGSCVDDNEIEFWSSKNICPLQF
jgi:hypothetical protein